MTALPPAEIATLLNATESEISAEVEGLPRGVATWHPAADEWCVNECIGHLIEAERRGFAGRIRFLLETEGTPVLTSWDQEAVARDRRDCGKETSALLREFRAERHSSVTLVRSLQRRDLTRGGEHSQVGYITVGDVVHEWLHHDRNHFKQMLSIVQARVWAQMGNAQRFSLPH